MMRSAYLSACHNSNWRCVDCDIADSRYLRYARSPGETLFQLYAYSY